MSTIVGIDPGNKGALAFLDPEESKMWIVDMATFTYETTRRMTKVDAYATSRVLQATPVSHIYLEEVAASPQMGVSSAFSFGEGYGILKGVTAALDIPLSTVKPQMWKKQLRVQSDKRMAVQRASQLFPLIAHKFKGPKGGILDGRAEAALLAFYGSMELGRTPTTPVTEWVLDDEGNGVL